MRNKSGGRRPAWQRGVIAHKVTWRHPPPERDSEGRVRTHDAAKALAKLGGSIPSKPAGIGIKVQACDSFKPYNKQRLRWTRERMIELASVYGDDLSRGVGARVRSAGWGFAFGEWIAAQAAMHGDSGLMAVAMRVLGNASAEDEKARELAHCEREMRKPGIVDLGKALDIGDNESTSKADAAGAKSRRNT